MVLLLLDFSIVALVVVELITEADFECEPGGSSPLSRRLVRALSEGRGGVKGGRAALYTLSTVSTGSAS